VGPSEPTNAEWQTATTSIGGLRSSTSKPAADVHADHWEMHPLADEAVRCLHGSIRLYLRFTQPDTPGDLVHLLPGRAGIVPSGRWHRLELDEPTELLAATVRRATELEEVSSRIATQHQVGKAIKGS
jgi:hypothetical protein